MLFYMARKFARKIAKIALELVLGPLVHELLMLPHFPVVEEPLAADGTVGRLIGSLLGPGMKQVDVLTRFFASRERDFAFSAILGPTVALQRRRWRLPQSGDG